MGCFGIDTNAGISIVFRNHKSYENIPQIMSRHIASLVGTNTMAPNFPDALRVFGSDGEGLGTLKGPKSSLISVFSMGRADLPEALVDAPFLA